ncbi:MAG: DUF3467 domain-containing protein [Candidatus Neomarinimicrobiota bacterium]
MEEKKKTQQINIELDQDVSSGEYANFVVVTHSPAEFVLDFTRILPGVSKAKVHSRIIMAPPHAKAFMTALQDNIRKFEEKYGEVKTPGAPFGVNPPENVLPN